MQQRATRYTKQPKQTEESRQTLLYTMENHNRKKRWSMKNCRKHQDSSKNAEEEAEKEADRT